MAIEAREFSLRPGISRDKISVRVVPNGREIPELGVITGVLNAALVVKFHPNLYTLSDIPEGGVGGMGWGEKIDLRNLTDTVGLYDMNHYENSRNTHIIFDFYHKMLVRLLKATNSFEGVKPEEERDKTWDALRVALIESEGEKFYHRVIRKVYHSNDPVKQQYLKNWRYRIDPEEA